MEMWHLWAFAGFALLVIEIFTPTTFFLTLAGASFFAGISAYMFPSVMWAQVVAFAVFVPIFYFAIKPVMDKKEQEPQLTGIDAKYIGKAAVVTRTIGIPNTDGLGEIKIYSEVWQAKSLDGCQIDKGANVKIVKNESLIMFVEKCE